MHKSIKVAVTVTCTFLFLLGFFPPSLRAATTEETLKAVVYGIVLTAVAQGVLAGAGYWFVGLRTPILLCVVTVFFAMIPFGAPVVWITASLWLMADGQHWAAISLALWGSLVVSWVDNIVRPLVISGATRIPSSRVTCATTPPLSNSWSSPTSRA